jgi:hypothetical protein
MISGTKQQSNVNTKIISLVYADEDLASNMAELIKSIVEKGNH